MLGDFINFIVQTVGEWGYAGIFLMMFLESSFFPFPSEVAMIPAGYLAHQGQMSLVLAWCAGTAGSLAGAVFNYYLCYFFGRELVLKYGKYVGITKVKMRKFEAFFKRHGEISTFNCRLIPGIRQYISLPAGLAKMNLFKFSLYTTLGAGIWVAILLAVGWYLGKNYDKSAFSHIVVALLAAVGLLTALYIFYVKRLSKKSKIGARELE
ncbi:putative membrane protein, DedA family, type II (SNARE domain) [Campylobacter showae]|uniref:SNARE-like domain protein n=1 Tax=Campylobacter showae RM3277 TaxID=553219 RepID=C6RFE5_9BACT|nr:DedA family protein [Campylobacter showae]EET79953.1 SNARE-like domain protein [Campylobacter showae RM3277]QCD48848.1 putative membrane protein, DedA family, type II (SNARE domain) [Campylobacter showae]